MTLTPTVAIHLFSALAALSLGPVAIWARRGATVWPRLHRAFGYAWVTVMVVAAVSAMFLRDFRLPNIWGYTPIHLFVPLTAMGLFKSFRALAQGDIARHRKEMQGLYYGACLGAGAFALLPSRFLGQLVWHQWLGLV